MGTSVQLGSSFTIMGFIQLVLTGIALGIGWQIASGVFHLIGTFFHP